MFARLLALFVIVPLVELYILFRLAEWTGLGATILLVLATGALGAWLARWQGLSTWRKIQHELNAGRLPGQQLVDGAMILVAAALLLTPGLLTDLFGFSLLLPPCRFFYRRLLMRGSWTVQFNLRQGSVTPADDPQVVDGHASPTADSSGGELN